MGIRVIDKLKPPSHTQDQYVMRFPAGLRDRIKAAAAQNRRSMNAEMVFHLERALSSADAATGEGLGNRAPAAALNETALAGGPINPR